jgi:hypothetical protein
MFPTAPFGFYLFPPCHPVSFSAYPVRYPPTPQYEKKRVNLILKKGVVSGEGMPLSVFYKAKGEQPTTKIPFPHQMRE